MEDFCTRCDQEALEVDFNRPTACQREGESCVQCTRLKQSEQVVLEAKAALRRALVYHSQLKAEHNHAYDPFSQPLPTEIACRIFAFCLPPTPTLEDFAHEDAWLRLLQSTTPPVQFTLGSVCQNWRRIVWSNPWFWNFIWFLFSRRTRPSFATLIEEWLARTGNVPLVISMHFLPRGGETLSDSDREINPSFVDPLLEILNLRANRCSLLAAHLPISISKRLHCDWDPDMQLSLEGLLISAPGIGFTQHSEGVFRLGIAPSLKVVSIVGLRLRNVHIEYHNLTHFRGFNLYAQDCVDLLRLSPQLLECSLVNLLGSIKQIDPIIHSSLKSIKLSIPQRDFFDAFTFSSLQRIELMTFGGIYPSIPFIRRSGHNLEFAKITNSRASDADQYFNFLEHTPSLKQLELANVDIGDDFFTHFGPTACTQEGQAPTLLPHLRSLLLRCHRSFEWSSLHQLKMSHPLSLTNQRPLRSIDITITNDPEDSEQSSSDSEVFDGPELIEREDLEKILEVIESGVDLKVQNSSNVDLIGGSQRYYGAREHLHEVSNR